MKLGIRVASALILALTLLSSAGAREPGWSGKVILRGAEEKQRQSTPILCRPYRPFHIYGNTVRRIHYRGTALPQPRDFAQARAALRRAR